jgi:phenylalanyl-tRNA synthetase beta subunit
MAFNVVFQSKDHTLTEQEISQTMAQIIAELEKRFNATLRK